MITFITTVLRNTPYFVWGILALLLVLGVKQTRAQWVTLSRIKMRVALVLGLSIFGAWSMLTSHAASLPFWAVGLLAGLVIGYLTKPSQSPQHEAHGRILIVGSYAPMCIYMSIFCQRYVMNVMHVVAPELTVSFGFVAIASLSYALPAGLMIARAWPALRTTEARHTTISLTMPA